MKIYLPKSLDEEIFFRQGETRRIKKEILEKKGRKLSKLSFKEMSESISMMAGIEITEFGLELQNLLKKFLKEYYKATTMVEMNFILTGNITNGDVVVDGAHLLYYTVVSDKGCLCYPFVFGGKGDEKRSKQEREVKSNELTEKLKRSRLEIVAELHTHPGECSKLVKILLPKVIDIRTLQLLKASGYKPDLPDYFNIVGVEGCKPDAHCFSPGDLNIISRNKFLGLVATLYCESGKKYIATNTNSELVEVEFYNNRK